MKSLSSVIKIGHKECKNRILMPPLVCFNWADENGLETESRADHYGKRSDAETGFIVIEAAGITEKSRIVASELGIWSDDHIPQYRAVAERCHQNKTLVVVQIVHAGIKAYPENVYTSSLTDAEGKFVYEMSQSDIEQVKEEFLNAARIAKKAGLDGVEVHGAHSYLLSQFTSPSFNKRTDIYGGSLENRYRLSLDIIKEIRAFAGEDFIISYRFGLNDPSFEDDIQAIRLLEEAGVDLFNVSSGIGIKPFDPPKTFPGSFIAYMGYKIKQHAKIPVACVFDIRDPEVAIKLIEKDYTDLVAIGRGLLADPEWSYKALNGLPINRCYHCKPRCKFAENGHLCPWEKRA